jgi:hypothetical protein
MLDYWPFARMKILPTKKQEWLSLASVPFKGYIIGVAIIYPYWLSHISGVPGLVGKGFLEQGMSNFASGCFVSFVALLFVALCQRMAEDRKGAFWNILFAIVAFCSGYLLIPYYTR